MGVANSDVWSLLPETAQSLSTKAEEMSTGDIHCRTLVVTYGIFSLYFLYAFICVDTYGINTIEYVKFAKRSLLSFLQGNGQCLFILGGGGERSMWETGWA